MKFQLHIQGRLCRPQLRLTRLTFGRNKGSQTVCRQPEQAAKKEDGGSQWRVESTFGHTDSQSNPRANILKTRLNLGRTVSTVSPSEVHSRSKPVQPKSGMRSVQSELPTPTTRRRKMAQLKLKTSRNHVINGFV